MQWGYEDDFESVCLCVYVHVSVSDCIFVCRNMLVCLYVLVCFGVSV